MRVSARLVVSGLALCLALLTAACHTQDRSAQAASAQAVSVVPAQMQTLSRSVPASGPVAAWEDMQLGVELSGLRVTQLLVDVGQQVQKGELLLALDHRSLDSDLAQANANMQQAQAGAELARSKYTRGQSLVEGHYISAVALDELRAARAQAEAQLGTARAVRDTAALRRSYAELRAPDAGLISKRLVQPGQVVAAGSELLRLIRQNRLEWRADLPEAQLAQVRVGQDVVLDGSGVHGRVRAVTPGVDSSSRTGTAYVDLPQPKQVQPGTYVQGKILIGQGAALVVPISAVLRRDGHAYVFVVRDGKHATRVRVEPGSSDGGQVEVRSGLKAGEQVVSAGAGFLSDGDLIRIVAASGSAP
ncbi:MAG TPA: efflux RND transporter periplasmic adaptor subunit [Thermomonas sp.]|jgi:RND family efflux transporter MFP subunit|nr:efflux RND transporter periplasmic adaptor subunit [Thermomonas sp.]HRA57169.1 efflux RND transporter periplasmic adaptor subunit [Thermomonas sp.]